jgi:hypothetical protein
MPVKFAMPAGHNVTTTIAAGRPFHQPVDAATPFDWIEGLEVIRRRRPPG